MRVCAAGLCVWLRWFVYVCMYVYVDKKWAVWSLTTGKSPVSVQGDLFLERNLLTGRKKGPGKLYYGKPCLVYMQCNYALQC